MTDIKLNEHTNVFEKIGLKAAKHALNALSRMLKQDVKFNFLKTNITKVEELSNIPDNKEEQVVGIYFKLLGEIQGIALIIFPIKSSYRIIDLFSKEKIEPTNKVETNFDKSILMETGNIVLGAYLTTFSSMTDILIIGSIPHITEDKMGSIFNSLVPEMGVLSDLLMTIEMEFVSSSDSIKGKIYLLIDNKTSEKITKVLNKSNEQY